MRRTCTLDTEGTQLGFKPPCSEGESDSHYTTIQQPFTPPDIFLIFSAFNPAIFDDFLEMYAV